MKTDNSSSLSESFPIYYSKIILAFTVILGVPLFLGLLFGGSWAIYVILSHLDYSNISNWPIGGWVTGGIFLLIYLGMLFGSYILARSVKHFFRLSKPVLVLSREGILHEGHTLYSWDDIKKQTFDVGYANGILVRKMIILELFSGKKPSKINALFLKLTEEDYDEASFYYSSQATNDHPANQNVKSENQKPELSSYEAKIKFPFLSFLSAVAGGIGLVFLGLVFAHQYAGVTIPFPEISDFLFKKSNFKLLLCLLIFEAVFLFYVTHLLSYLQHRGRALSLTQNTIEFGTRSYTYSQVAEISSYGLPKVITIKFTDKFKIKLYDYMWPDADVWYPILQQKTHDIIVKQAENAMTRGETISFGVVKINKDVLIAKTKSIPWHSVAGSRIKTITDNETDNSKIIIYHDDTSISVSKNSVFNIHALQTLICKMAGYGEPM